MEFVMMAAGRAGGELSILKVKNNLSSHIFTLLLDTKLKLLLYRPGLAIRAAGVSGS
jgi:hypothetical protein